MRRLVGTRAYLCGPMDRVADGGVGWRNEITPFLHDLGVFVMDPCDKPLDEGKGDETDREERRRWIADGNWEALRDFMREVRGMDLRMVNVSDFVIAWIDMDSHMCGSYEEIAIANHEKKPILSVCKQGKAQAPWWLFGQIPHEHIFSCLDELRAYLHHVDTAEKVETYKRWYFFNFAKAAPPSLKTRLGDRFPMRSPLKYGL